MMPFQQCPVCGGEMVEKQVEKLLRGGVHTATVTVRAEVCLRCGERLYPAEITVHVSCEEDLLQIPLAMSAMIGQ